VKIGGLILLVLLVAFSHVLKAQTVTDPWASMGGANSPPLIAIVASTNFYIAPVAAAFQAPAIFTPDLLLNLDVENPASFPGNRNTMYGDINTALVYLRGLSSTQVLQNFNVLKSRFGLKFL
jgi:hypothetical protein